MSRWGWTRALLAAVVLLSSSVLARAAEEGGSPAEQPIGTIFKWIHFMILAGLAYWVFAKLLPPMFRRTADNISAAIAKATAAKAEAEKQLQNTAAKLANLEKEIAEFRAIAQREASAEIERLRMITKGDVEKIGQSGNGSRRARGTRGIEGAGGKTGGGWSRIAGSQADDAQRAGSPDQSVCGEPAGEAELRSASLQYANALADIALEQGAAESVLKQLSEFGAAFAESAELRTFLATPGVAREVKHGVIEKLAARMGASKIIRNFLFVMVDNQRTPLLPDILEAFQEVIRRRQGVAEAEVSSAVNLSDAQKVQLLQTLERLTSKKIQAKYALEPELLGGAVVRIGDTIYDGSLRSRLNEMRARLTAE
jgi:F-type H+-transporting ATPase subunit delta